MASTKTGSFTPLSDMLEKQPEELKQQHIQKMMDEQPGEQNRHANLSNKIAASGNKTPAQADSLILTTRDNKKVELSSTRLEQWFAAIETKNQTTQSKDKAPPSAPLSTQLLGRFGLRSANEVLAFLKSPAGTAVKARINDRLMEIAQIKEEQLFQYREKEKRKQRALAFFLLGMLYKKEAKEKQRKELIQQQNEKALKTQAPANQPAPTESVQSIFEDDRTALNESAIALQNEINLMAAELERLENELAQLYQQKQEIEARYYIFDEHLDLLDDFLIALSNEDETEQHQQALLKRVSMHEELLTGLEKQSESADENDKILLTEQKQDVQNKIHVLNNRLTSMRNPQLRLDKENQTKAVQNKLAQLQEKINSQTEIIATLLEEGKDEEARLLLNEVNGLHMEGVILHDALSTLQDEKALYDEQGQVTQCFHKAAFIVPSSQKLIVDGDKCYLLSNDQDFETLKENPAELAAANSAFERAKPNIVNVKTLVATNKQLENEAHTQKAEAAIQRCNNTRSHIDTCQKQLVQITQEQKALTLQIQQLAPLPKPAPKPEPKPRRVERPAEEFSLPSFQDALSLMQQRPTPEALGNILEKLKNLRDKGDPRLYSVLSTQLAAIKPFFPIPQPQMDSLRANIERFAGSVPKQSIPVAKPELPRSPTPFSMKPPGAF